MEEDLRKEDVADAASRTDDKKPFKREWSRFEFALFINDFLVCKRSFSINGYVDGSMQTKEFKDEVDKIVEIIDDDLKAKSRVYTWYHFWPEMPEWEPEITTDPLIEEGEFMLRFVVYDNGEEVISRQWDARYYPSYVRKGIDLTNRQVKITKEDRTYTYDKESFFASHDNLSGDLYVLRAMIADRENLVPIIQKHIYEVCSSFDGYYEKPSDYHTVIEYKNTEVVRGEDGKPIYIQKEENGVKEVDAFGKPVMVPVLTRSSIKPKKYCFNLEAHNRKVYSAWGAEVSEKTKKYMSELYVSPKERFFRKNAQ